MSTDPLRFTDTKPYRERLTSEHRSHRHEGRRGRRRRAHRRLSRRSSRRWSTASSAAAWAWSSARRSRGPSSGRSRRRQPMIIVSCSGGARMMEGALSLMQMAKICAALARLDQAAPALYLDPDRPDHRRRHGQLRHARRPQHRRTGRADRLRGTARHRADDPPEAARGLPAQRVPARARHARPHRRPPRDEGRDRQGAPVHGPAWPTDDAAEQPVPGEAAAP